MVVQNSQREITAALSRRVPMPSLMIILETLAARRVVHFIQEIGHHRSILEGDSESSINALCHKNLLESYFIHLV